MCTSSHSSRHTQVGGGGVNHTLPSQVEEGEAGEDQEVAPFGICRNTHRLINT